MKGQKHGTKGCSSFEILSLIRMSLKMKILMNFSYFLFTFGYFPKPMEKEK